MRTLKLSLLAICSVVGMTSAQAQPYQTEFGSGEIVVNTLRRTSDDTILVKGIIKNTSSQKYWLAGSKLLGTNQIIDVKLQDLKSKRQFEQITIERKAVGSSHADMGLDSGASIPFWARVTAPPKDVTEVAIIFGGDALPIDKATISE